MAKIIDGKSLAMKIRKEITREIKSEIIDKGLRRPGLAVIIVGDNVGANVYVRNKADACKKAGFLSRQIILPESTSVIELTMAIGELNEDDSIDGILVGLPIPHHIDETEILDLIHPAKDVDGFHPENIGRMVVGHEDFVPCTAMGIMRMLGSIDVTMDQKQVVILGRSNIVGKPMSILSMQKRKGANGTVTLCHSGTPDLKEKAKTADILISAIGQANFVTSDMVKKGAVVIDVGINRNNQGKLCGDVDFENVAPLCKAISPVPGGVGPMTIAMLLVNTLKAYKNRERLKAIDLQDM